MSIEGIKADLIRRWLDQPVGELCLKIVNHMAGMSNDQMQFMTYTTFAKILGKNQVDEETVVAITVLTNSSISALESHALFIDENDTEHEIDPEELFEALTTGALVHPETGDIIENFSSRLIPFYAPSERFLSEQK